MAKESGIKLLPISSIPADLLEAFKQETGSHGPRSFYVMKAQQSEIKIGAFNEKKEIIGFIAASKWNDILSAHAAYVKPDYRRKGIGTRLFYRICGEAKKRGMKGVDLNDVMKSMRDMTQKQREKFSVKGKNAPLFFELIPAERSESVTVRFNMAKNKPPIHARRK